MIQIEFEILFLPLEMIEIISGSSITCFVSAVNRSTVSLLEKLLLPLLYT